MIRPLTRSTLFPYTTLFRSQNVNEWLIISFAEAREQRKELGRLIDAVTDVTKTVQGFASRLEKVEAFQAADRKSTRLNSSHPSISYAVFCLKKKNQLSIVTM